MVLVFEDKTYESVGERIMFSLFKIGYISHKYQFLYKTLHIFEVILEFGLIIFLLSANQNDLTSNAIRMHGNIYNNLFNENSFFYSNFDSSMSFFINFMDIMNKLNVDSYTIILIIFLVSHVLKFGEFCYFLRARVPVINAKGCKKLIFLMFSFIDQAMKSFGDIVAFMITFGVFSCQDGKNIFLEIECYMGYHIILVIISGCLLFYLLTYLLLQCIFYDPCNLISKDNFGISDNMDRDALWVLAKVELVLLDLYTLLGSNQEIIKIAIFFGITLLSIYLINKNICKFHDFYQNGMIFCLASVSVYSAVLFLYVIFKNRISLIGFLLMIVGSMMIGFLITQVIRYYKTYKLYTREQDLESYPKIIYVLEMILRYYSNKTYKIIINGFIQCYNIEHGMEPSDCKEIDEIISLNKNSQIDYNDTITILKEYIKPNNVKYLLTINNMLILGSVREVLARSQKKKECSSYKKYKQMKLLEFLTNLISKYSVHSHHHSFYFKHLITQIFLRKLNNYTKSWYILSNFYETFNKLSIRQKFYIFCMFQELHETLQKADERSIHKEAKMKKVMKLDKINSKFLSKICQTTTSIKMFWINYMNDKQKMRLSSSNISLQLKKISRKFSKLEHFFTEIQKLYEDNPMVFYIYCCFLKNIMNNDQLSEHIIKLLNDYKETSSNNPIGNSFIDDDYYKMTNIEELGLLITSCNNLEFGKIKWCNTKLSNILGYSQSDLSKLKLNRIIPPVIAAKHNEYIKSFIQTNREFFSNMTRVGFLTNSSDYLTPIMIYLKVFPRIKNGIEMCALIHKIIDNTFILYKNPEIKVNTKLCFVLINEDGSIESVDRNANTFIGIPNLVRNGWKTKITIDKRKCNLFELSPGLKDFIERKSDTLPIKEKNSIGGVPNMNVDPGNRFLHECTVDTTLLAEDFTNDEYGLFLSINSRIHSLVAQNSTMWIEKNDYYESDDNDEGNGVNNRQRHEFQSMIVPRVFRSHNLVQEIYEIKASKLNLYVIKYYFPVDNTILSYKEKQGDKEKEFLNAGKGEDKNNFKNIYQFNIIRTSSKVLLDNANQGDNAGSLKKKTQLAISVPPTPTGISLNANQPLEKGGTLNKTNSGTIKQVKDNIATTGTFTRSHITLEKLRLRKEIMIQEKAAYQGSSYRTIQILFLLIVIVLISLISAEVALRITELGYLTPLKNILFKFVTRRDLTSNLILNLQWHVTMSNLIEDPKIFQQFRVDPQKILSVMKEDVIRGKSEQTFIENMYDFIKEIKIYSNYTTSYFEYDSFHQIHSLDLLIDRDYDLFFSDFDKYFDFTDYSVENPERLLHLLNPSYYLQSEVFEINDLEKRLSNIFTNGFNLIQISDSQLSEILRNYIVNISKSNLDYLRYMNIAAICFTGIFSIVVMILFLNLYNIQEDVFKTFSKLENSCAVKVVIICDKFLKLITHVNNGRLEKLRSFYYMDHITLYALIMKNSLEGEKKNLRSKASLRDGNILPNIQSETPKETTVPTIIKRHSQSSISSDSKVSNNRRSIIGSSHNTFIKRKNSDEEIILSYKRYLEKGEEKPNKQKEEEEVVIERNKQIYISTFFLTLTFIILISGYFILLLLLDYHMNDYLGVVLNYYNFHEKRGFYTINSVIFLKFLILTSTKSSYNPMENGLFIYYLNSTMRNEEKIQSFILNGNQKIFDSDIQTIDGSSACKYFSSSSGYTLANNITVVTSDICSNEDEFKDVINSPLTEIIIFIVNYLRNKYNLFFFLSKTPQNILSFLNDPKLQYVQILLQYIIRQSLNMISEKINTNFQQNLDQYYSYGILLFVIFLFFLLVIIFVSNLVAFFIFTNKKRRNELLINLIPDEFLKKIEEEEEEKERRKEID